MNTILQGMRDRANKEPYRGGPNENYYRMGWDDMSTILNPIETQLQILMIQYKGAAEKLMRKALGVEVG